MIPIREEIRILLAIALQLTAGTTCGTTATTVSVFLGSLRKPYFETPVIMMQHRNLVAERLSFSNLPKARMKSLRV